MTVVHAWLQKHPSPSAAGGEFHWHPPDRDRELRASCVERMRGIEPPAVLWQLAPGRVAWAQLFSATAPRDHRPYVGVVLTTVERAGARPAELLAEVTAPPPAPWQSDVASAVATGDAAWPDDDAVAVARALLSGGAAGIAGPASPRLAARLASLERVMPAAVTARARDGVCSTRRIAKARDPVAELAVCAARDPDSRAARAWQLLCELAAARDRETLDETAAELARLDDVLHDALTPGERELGDASGFVSMLHAWGRGRLDRSAAIATLPARLADVLALRVLAQLVRGDDGGAALAEARWHALLPAARRAALLDALAARAPSLRALVEAHHA